jgi:hypothetical protein
MPRADGFGSAPAFGDPVRDGGLICAGFDAQLRDRQVLGFVQGALVESDRDAGAFGEKVAASGCQLG